MAVGFTRSAYLDLLSSLRPNFKQIFRGLSLYPIRPVLRD
jgi:hypothetical protein